MFVKAKSADNRIFLVPKTFYETVLKNNGFTLVESEVKQEVKNVKYNARIERQNNKESDKTDSK